MRRVTIMDRTATRTIGIHTGVTGLGAAATGITAKPEGRVYTINIWLKPNFDCIDTTLEFEHFEDDFRA